MQVENIFLLFDKDAVVFKHQKNKIPKPKNMHLFGKV